MTSWTSILEDKYTQRQLGDNTPWSSMNDIPDFEDAIGAFRRFLVEQGHPGNIFWVFREDIWKRSPVKVVLRLPSHTKNLALAKEIFDEGRRKGLVELQAIATAGDQVAATVWFPKSAEEEIQGFGWRNEAVNPGSAARCRNCGPPQMANVLFEATVSTSKSITPCDPISMTR